MDDEVDDDATAPLRRVVMHPSTAEARRRAHVADPTPVRGQRVPALLVAGLVARQRRLAVSYGLALGGSLALLPVLLPLLDTSPAWWPAGWPPPAWLVLPAGTLAFLLALGASHARRATRLEERWLREVAGSGPGEPERLDPS